MGFFKKLFKSVKNVAQSVGNTIANTAKSVVKVIEKPVEYAHKALDFVEDHAKDIKGVVDVIAEVGEGIGTLTGQPEITGAFVGLKVAADKGLSVAAKAKQITDVADRAVELTKAVAHKENVAQILNKTSALIATTATNTKDPQTKAKLQELAHYTDKAQQITKTAIDHSKSVIKNAKNIHTAVKSKNVKNTVKHVKSLIKDSKEIVKDAKNIKKGIKEVKHSPKIIAPVKKTPVKKAPIKKKPVKKAPIKKKPVKSKK